MKFGLRFTYNLSMCSLIRWWLCESTPPAHIYHCFACFSKSSLAGWWIRPSGYQWPAVLTIRNYVSALRSIWALWCLNRPVFDTHVRSFAYITLALVNLCQITTYCYCCTLLIIYSFDSLICAPVFSLSSIRLFSSVAFLASNDYTVSFIACSLFKYWTVKEFKVSSALFSISFRKCSSAFFRYSISVLSNFLSVWIFSSAPAYFSVWASRCFFVS